jgi:hypothetical protein
MTALHVTFWKITTSLQRNLHKECLLKLLCSDGRKNNKIFSSNVLSGTKTIILNYGTTADFDLQYLGGTWASLYRAVAETR